MSLSSVDMATSRHGCRLAVSPALDVLFIRSDQFLLRKHMLIELETLCTRLHTFDMFLTAA